MIRISTRIDSSGPLFDARAARIMRDYVDELEEDAAEDALNDVRQTFHEKFKHPTGYYESRVHVTNITGHPMVWDGGHAGPRYGPWLEGVGSRNQTTRFKGYHAFRDAAQRLQRRIEGIGYRLFDRNYQHRF